MADSVYKFIELVGTSTESWKKAAVNAVETTAKTQDKRNIARANRYLSRKLRK